MLQSVNTLIDTIQDAKKQIVKTFVQDKTLAETINEFLESQRTFTKQVAKTTFEVATESAKQVAKFDMSKVKL